MLAAQHDDYSMLGRITSQISNHQDSLLAPIYPMIYLLGIDGRKDKKSSFTDIETFNAYVINIHGVLLEYINVYQMIKCTHCSMKKQ